MRSSSRPRWWTGLMAVLLAGCVTVHIESADAPVRVVRHVGLLQIELAAPEAAIAGSLSGVGLTATPMGWSAGYTRQRWAALGPACRAVVWLDRAPLDAPTRDALAAAAGVCLLDEPPAGAVARTAGPRPLQSAAAAHETAP